MSEYSFEELIALKKRNTYRLKDLLQTNNYNEIKKCRDFQEFLLYELSKYKKQEQNVNTIEFLNKTSNLVKWNTPLTSSRIIENQYEKRSILLQQEADRLFPDTNQTQNYPNILTEYTQIFTEPEPVVTTLPIQESYIYQ